MKQIIETVAYIHIENKRILLAQAKGKKAYLMPGGKKEKDEDNIAALIREIQEELSVYLEPDSIQFYKTFEAQAHGKPKGVIVRTHCYFGKHTGTLKPNNEIADLKFFTQQEYSQMEDYAPLGIVINKDLKENNLIK